MPYPEDLAPLFPAILGSVPQPMHNDILSAHGTQSPILVRGTYSYADQIPAWAYFRFWDRDDFALAWAPRE